MTPELCLISVPHNGTVFTIEMFKANGWNEAPLNGRHATPVLYQGHCEKTSQCVQALELAERMPMVVPLRHPYRVEESWKRRGENTLRLMRSYINLLDGLKGRVTAFLPIDAEPVPRLITHVILNDVARKWLTVDWDVPVNVVHGTHAMPLSELDPSPEIINISRDPLFVEFYGEAHL